MPLPKRMASGATLDFQFQTIVERGGRREYRRAIGNAYAHVVLAKCRRAVHDARAAVGGDIAVRDHAECAARPLQRRKVREQWPVRASRQLASLDAAQHLRSARLA